MGVHPHMKRLGYFSLGALAGLAVHYRKDYTQLLFDASTEAGRLVRLLDGETSHILGIWTMKHGLMPKDTRPDPAILQSTVWGKTFSSPVGLAAGFDKNAEAAQAALDLGFSFVEIGSVTPLPQPGNPKPRVFRLTEAGAVINRYGFNNDGVDVIRQRLEEFKRRRKPESPGVLGVNLGKNKTTEDAATDYCIGVSKLAPFADYLVVNVSSPNTPGLRALQGRKQLESLVSRVLQERDSIDWQGQAPPPLLIKIAPDLTSQDKEDIAAVVVHLGVDGLIVSNTTIERPPEVAALPHGTESGGLSGKPLFEPSTAVLRDMYRLTRGQVPLIGVGGIFTGEQAYAKIRAGASLVQLYTALALEGPALIRKIKLDLAQCLERDGFASLSEAVGADHRENGAETQGQEKSSSSWFWYFQRG